MSDFFTLDSIPLTAELGMALKNFRIENKVTAKSITEHFNKASSYISKLENGDIKKIESDFFVALCNYITGSDNGLVKFMLKIAQNYVELSNETKIIIMNIDDLLISHQVSRKFIDEINNYINTHNIAINQIVSKINQNEDIADIAEYNSLPLNQWYSKDNNIDNVYIKLSIVDGYIENLLAGNIQFIHRVIAESILYSIFRLGNENKPRILAYTKLNSYKIEASRRAIAITEKNIDNLYAGLEPDTANALKTVISGLKLITSITNEYGTKKIKSIADNMKEDLGFFFAYMSTDLVALTSKSKNQKQDFLNELKVLIDKYSKDETGLDIYQ